jgi:hypothetical protein
MGRDRGGDVRGHAAAVVDDDDLERLQTPLDGEGLEAAGERLRTVVRRDDDRDRRHRATRARRARSQAM